MQLSNFKSSVLGLPDEIFDLVACNTWDKIFSCANTLICWLRSSSVSWWNIGLLVEKIMELTAAIWQMTYQSNCYLVP